MKLQKDNRVERKEIQMKGNSYNWKIRKTGKKIVVTTLVAALAVSAMPGTNIPLRVYAEESLMTQTIDGMVIENGVLKRYDGNASEVVIPEGVVSIGEYAFNYKDCVESVTIPESVKKIEKYAFFKCENLESVDIQGTIDQIDSLAFSVCSKLSQIDLSQVKEFGTGAFNLCTSLKSVELDNVQVIEEGAFNGTGIESAVLNFTGENAELSHRAFSSCQNLTTVTIKGNLSIIGNAAFLRCKSLEDIQIENPSAITSIGARAFEQTPWLKEQCSQSENKMLIINHILVSYLPNVYYAGEYDGIPYEELSEEEERVKMTDENFTYTEPVGAEMETVTIPGDVTAIAGQAFYGAYSVKEIKFDSQIKNIEIGDYAFEFTTWQQEYLEKEDFLIIGGNLVRGKYNSEVVQIPNGVKKILYNAFMDENKESVKEIIWPQSVEEGPILAVASEVMKVTQEGDTKLGVEKMTVPTSFEAFCQEYNIQALEWLEFKDVDTSINANDLLSGYSPENTPTPTAADEPEETPTPTVTMEPEETPIPTITDEPDETPTPIVSSVPTPAKEAILVHFKSTEGKPRLSFWNGSGVESNPSSWSEVDMEPEGDGWYKYILGDMESTSLVFKTAEGDTEQLYIVSGEWWYTSGEWYSYLPEEGVTPTVTVEPTVTEAPVLTSEPTATEVPMPTIEPTVTEAIMPTVEPTTIISPAATQKPTAISTPKPTATKVPQPTKAPQPTKVVTPTPTSKPVPTVTVKKATISKAVRVSSTKIKVTMKKTEKVKGYQIVASTDKKFKKNVKKVTTSKQSVTLKKLKKGKTYYVKVRAYKLNQKNKKVYGKYSAVKKVSK